MVTIVVMMLIMLMILCYHCCCCSHKYVNEVEAFESQSNDELADAELEFISIYLCQVCVHMILLLCHVDLLLTVILFTLLSG